MAPCFPNLCHPRMVARRPRFQDDRSMAASPQSPHLPPYPQPSSRPLNFTQDPLPGSRTKSKALMGRAISVFLPLSCSFGTPDLSRCTIRLLFLPAASPTPFPDWTLLSRSSALALWGHAQYLTSIRIRFTNPIYPSSALSQPSHRARLQPCLGRCKTPEIPYCTPKWNPSQPNLCRE